MTWRSGARLRISTTLSCRVRWAPLSPLGCYAGATRAVPANQSSDGEEILGIGDQGVGGVLISVAKLVLTTLCAGIHPDRTLPVVLDCGTNNEKLLNDDLYLGLKEKRVRGEEYDKFVDKFVTAARKLYPRAYVHFEDFGLTNGKPPPPPARRSARNPF